MHQKSEGPAASVTPKLSKLFLLRPRLDETLVMKAAQKLFNISLDSFVGDIFEFTSQFFNNVFTCQTGLGCDKSCPNQTTNTDNAVYLVLRDMKNRAAIVVITRSDIGRNGKPCDQCVHFSIPS